MSVTLLGTGSAQLSAGSVLLSSVGGTVTSGGSSGTSGTSGTSGSSGTSGTSGTSGGTTPLQPSGIDQVTILFGGQSNAGYACTVDGASASMVKGVAFYLGATSATQLSSEGNTGAATSIVSGAGIFDIADFVGWHGYYLDNVNQTSAPTVADGQTAPLGADGTGFETYLANLSSAERNNIQALALYWGETDSITFNTEYKAVYKACCVNWMGQVRTMLSRTVAELPILWFGPPYGGEDGESMVREVWAELAADPAQGVTWLVPQTWDSNGRNDAYNAQTGVVTPGSDEGHRDAPDNIAIYNRGCLATARAILKAAGVSQSVIPAELGQGFGPSVVSASISGTVVTVTIQHDGGTDLVLPLLATKGVGWTILDGGTVQSPGAIIQATSCTYVNPTTLQVTFASAPVNSPANCRLCYPSFGPGNPAQPGAAIGRGDAVTDNWASISAASALNIAGALGNTYGRNFPLQPPYTVTGSGPTAIAEWGIPLS